MEVAVSVLLGYSGEISTQGRCASAPLPTVGPLPVEHNNVTSKRILDAQDDIGLRSPSLRFIWHLVA